MAQLKRIWFQDGILPELINVVNPMENQTQSILTVIFWRLKRQPRLLCILRLLQCLTCAEAYQFNDPESLHARGAYGCPLKSRIPGIPSQRVRPANGDEQPILCISVPWQGDLALQIPLLVLLPHPTSARLDLCGRCGGLAGLDLRQRCCHWIRIILQLWAIGYM